jgi:FkbM family methyltransferase
MPKAFLQINEHTVYAPALGGRPRVLDIGANHGQFAQAMRRRFDADIRLVEANPQLYGQLSSEGTFPVWHCAVAEGEGTIPFHIAQADQGSSILTLPAESDLGCVLRETVTVPARTLTSIVEETGWDRVDLIKMDIEGAEVGVLDSLEPDVLGRVGQFTIEFHSDPMFRFDLHDRSEACLRRMEALGFFVLDFSYEHRLDVLLINTGSIRLPPIKRAFWRLKYDPPAPLYRLLRMMPKGLRKGLVRWRNAETRPGV